MSLHEKVFASFNEHFEGDERQVMVFLAGLGREILASGGMRLAEAANNAIQKYAASDLKGPDKKKKAMAEVRAALDDEGVSDTAIDGAIQAALGNYRAMKASRPAA